MAMTSYDAARWAANTTRAYADEAQSWVALNMKDATTREKAAVIIAMVNASANNFAAAAQAGLVDNPKSASLGERLSDRED